jgi:hypothetical protein
MIVACGLSPLMWVRSPMPHPPDAWQPARFYSIQQARPLIEAETRRLLAQKGWCPCEKKAKP